MSPVVFPSLCREYGRSGPIWTRLCHPHSTPLHLVGGRRCSPEKALRKARLLDHRGRDRARNRLLHRLGGREGFAAEEAGSGCGHGVNNKLTAIHVSPFDTVEAYSSYLTTGKRAFVKSAAGAASADNRERPRYACSAERGILGAGHRCAVARAAGEVLGVPDLSSRFLAVDMLRNIREREKGASPLVPHRLGKGTKIIAGAIRVQICGRGSCGNFLDELLARLIDDMFGSNSCLPCS
jgi:hypothetical protein